MSEPENLENPIEKQAEGAAASSASNPDVNPAASPAEVAPNAIPAEPERKPEFAGFHQEGFDFFANLSENNNPEWFRENEENFREHVLAPFRTLVRDLGHVTEKLNPALMLAEDEDEHLSWLEKGPKLPPGTPPYKTSFYAYFWDTALNRLSDANLYVGMNKDGVSIGFSIYRNRSDRRCQLNTVMMPRVRRQLEKLDEYIKVSYLRRGFDFHRYAAAPGRIGIKEVDAFPTKPIEWEDTEGWVATRRLHTDSSRLTPGSFLHEVTESFQKLYPLYAYCADPDPGWRKLFTTGETPS